MGGNHGCKNCGYAEEVVMKGRYCSLLDQPIDDYDSCQDWTLSSHGMREQIEQIADTYEFQHQTIKLFEEMGELQQALAKLMLDNGPDSEYDANLPNVKEELADVQIMLLQIMYLLDISEVGLRQIMKGKLDRQINRMGGDK